MRLAWLPAAVALVLGLALVTHASAAERLVALDPFEIYAHGFDDPRGIVVDGQGNVFVADREAGTVTRITPHHTHTVVARRLSAPSASPSIPLAGSSLPRRRRAASCAWR